MPDVPREIVPVQIGTCNACGRRKVIIEDGLCLRCEWKRDFIEDIRDPDNIRWCCGRNRLSNAYRDMHETKGMVKK